MTIKDRFLKQKLENIFQNYSYIFIIQHNTVVSDVWKKIKKELTQINRNTTTKTINQNSAIFSANSGKENLYSSESLSPSFHIIPNRIIKTLYKGAFFLENQIQINDKNKISLFNGPCCFLGCHSPHDLRVFYKILKEMKLSPYSLFCLGLYIKNDFVKNQFNEVEMKQKYSFFNSLEVQKILSITKKEDFEPVFDSSIIYPTFVEKSISLQNRKKNIPSELYSQILMPTSFLQFNLFNVFSFVGTNFIHSLNSNQLTLTQYLDFYILANQKK